MKPEKIGEFAWQKGIEYSKLPALSRTRLIHPLINEAMYASWKGSPSAEDIDTAMKLGYNMQTGPLETRGSHRVRSGLDIHENIYSGNPEN